MYKVSNPEMRPKAGRGTRASTSVVAMVPGQIAQVVEEGSGFDHNHAALSIVEPGQLEDSRIVLRPVTQEWVQNISNQLNSIVARAVGDFEGVTKASVSETRLLEPVDIRDPQLDLPVDVRDGKVDSLWVNLLRAKYKCTATIPDELSIRNGSRLWKGLGVIWSDMCNNVVWNIGDGRSIKFWLDNWLGELGPLVNNAMGPVDIFLLYKSIADMGDGQGSWRWDKFSKVLLHSILARFAATNGPTPWPVQDSIGWKGTLGAQFSVKDAYLMRAGHGFQEARIWKLVLYILEALQRPWKVMVQYFPRTDNIVADQLAKLAHHASIEIIVLEQLPLECQEAVRRDGVT
ncbi:hypothetical protein V6N13_042467 [Hibiscus sabdariffa]